jgi:hypothetical protein
MICGGSNSAGRVGDQTRGSRVLPRRLGNSQEKAARSVVQIHPVPTPFFIAVWLYFAVTMTAGMGS